MGEKVISWNIFKWGLVSVVGFNVGKVEGRVLGCTHFQGVGKVTLPETANTHRAWRPDSIGKALRAY